MSKTAFSDEVVRELQAMQRLGMRIPQRAFDIAQTDATIRNGAANGMRVSEAADLALDLARFR